MGKVNKGLVVALAVLVILVGLVAQVSATGTEPDPLVELRGKPQTYLATEYTWDIWKSADRSAVTLSLGEQVVANYTVAVDVTQIDGGWHVEGYVDVFNKSTQEATLTSIEGVISPDIQVDLVCSVPAVIPAGWTKRCTYDVVLPNGDSRVLDVTAQVEMADGTVLNLVRAYAIDFSSATVEETGTPCVSVWDSQIGLLDEPVCEDKTFTYERWIGPYDVCGEYVVENIATIKVPGTGEVLGSSTVIIPVDVPCAGGCTLTPGYWKTHSEYGPAPYDGTWAFIGENTPFFLSGQSYYEVLWTAPKKGNAYYILAHAYIAAQLNELNGAYVPGNVADAMAEATAIFAGYTPDEIAALGKKSDVRADMISLAELLDNYNNGFIGPGHCSE